MGLCNCFGECDCMIEGAGQVSVTGSGDVADPFIINGLETPFDLTSLSAALVVNPGGDDGHEPSIDFAIDPDSEAPVSITPAGLRIDCCASDPADFAISEEVCNNLSQELDGIYADAGGMILDPGGTIVRTIPSAGNVSAESWNRTVTNNEDCSILVRVAGNPVAIQTTSSGALAIYLDAAFRMSISGGGSWIGGGTVRSSRVWVFDPNVAAGGEVYPTAAMMSDFALIPAGASRTFTATMATTRRQNHGSSTYEFQTPSLVAWRVRRTNLDIGVSG